MPLINRSFNGKLNLDASPFKLPPNDFIDALNITRDGQGDGQDRIVSNIVGNQRVLYHLPPGINKRIGSKADPLRDRVYYWIWNSYGKNLWLYYDHLNDTIVKLIEDLTDTDNIPVLDFDPSFRINHADIIYRDEGDLVSWTDGHRTPKEANVDVILAGTYGVIQSNFIEAAKMPPLTPPICEYQTDATRTGNSLRRKLFQFSSAYKYDTFAMSTPSTFSKIPLPVGEFGSDDTDNSSNNNISIIVETGDKNVTDIEIYMRSNIGDAWSDFVTIIVLNKAQLNILDNSTYQYYFYNDNIYPTPTQNFQYVDGVQVVPLFDWVPQLANTQCQPNGNVKAFGAITENYDNYPVSELDVELTAENVTNVPGDTDPPQLTYQQIGDATYTFTVAGGVPTGTTYKIYIYFNGTPPAQTRGVFLVGNYTSIGGDSIDDVAFNLYSQFNSFSSVPSIIGSYAADTWQSNLGTGGSNVFRVDVVSGAAPSGISSQSTWLWDCPYALGLVYIDEQGRSMPGVTTYANPAGGDNDFVVNTPSFSLDGSTPQTPVLSFSINHLPPPEAVKYNIVRRRLAFGNFIFYETCDYQEEDGYLYFCLANIDEFKTQNSQFIYSTAPIIPESRIRIIAAVQAGMYNGTLYAEDYQILGTVVRTVTSGTSPDDDKPFIKVKAPTSVPAYIVNMLVMVYTPMLNPTNNADSIYWEWGETYDIYELDGVNYHAGLDQDQTASQPATFTFIEGDVYYRTRTMFSSLLLIPPSSTDSNTIDIMDGNYSDYFDSLVNNNGRGQAIAANARRQFNPVLIRFSEAYQAGTSINGLNRFYYENFVEEDRSWGSIQKLFIDRRYLYVFQEFNTGVVPILTQIVRDTAGNPLEANSDILLNKIAYPYDKQYGIGNVPESFAYGKSAMYGIDNNKGIVFRLTPENGMQAISVLYECNAFFVARLAAYKDDLNNGNAPHGGIYTGNPTCYGIFDSYTNKYIISLEEINRYNAQGYLTFHQDAETIAFLETRDEDEGFESKYSYHSEGMESLNNLLISFKEGELWKHDSDTYCQFYGINYTAYITGVFNDAILQKKTWEALTLISEVKWSCPVIYTNVNSYGNVKQESELIEEDFELFEQYPSAGLKKDKNSVGGLLNGNWLKGGYIVIRFQKNDASNLVILCGVSLVLRDSALTGN